MLYLAGRNFEATIIHILKEVMIYVFKELKGNFIFFLKKYVDIQLIILYIGF